MTHFQTQFASALAAVLLVTVSIGVMFNAPPVQAHAVQAHVASIELA